jgi:hypothetical protein
MTGATPALPPPGGGQYSQPDARSGEPGEPAISFADLLASLRQTPVAGANVEQLGLESGGTGSKRPVEPESFLGAEADQVAIAPPKHRMVAEIFNEHGLTQPLDVHTLAVSETAPAGMSPAVAGRALAPAPNIAAASPVATPTNAAPAIERGSPAAASALPASAAVGAEGLISSPGSAEHASKPRLRGGKGDPTTPQPSPSKPAHRNEGSPAHAGAERQERTSRLKAALEKALSAAQAKDVQLTLEFAEQGMRIFAWIGNLARVDRARLRSEIARLVEAHGMPAIEVRLNGEEIDALGHGKNG